MKNNRNLYSNATGRLVGVGIPNLAPDNIHKKLIKNINQRRREDPDYNLECVKKRVMGGARAKALKKTVSLPKLKCLEKNEEN